jgi:hypothetical protein
MYHHDYTQELGLISPEKRVSRPVAIAILGLVAAGAYFGAVALRRVEPEPVPAPATQALPVALAAVAPAANLAPAHPVSSGN